jgi:hypothetical protein
MAGVEQAKRLTKDPWFEALHEAGLGDMAGKISSRPRKQIACYLDE